MVILSLLGIKTNTLNLRIKNQSWNKIQRPIISQDSSDSSVVMIFFIVSHVCG